MNIRQTATGRRQTADGNRQTADGNRQTADGRRQTAIGRRQAADDRRQTAAGGRQTAAGGPQRASHCRVAVIAIVFGALSLASRSAEAQSLADVAKKEAERRGSVAKSSKVYTNSDLTEDFTRPASPPAPVPPPREEAPAAKGPDGEQLQVAVAAPGTEVERQAPSDKGEDYWRNRASSIRNAINAQQSQIAGLEQRLQGLAEAASGTDQRERELLSTLLTKAKADLVSLQEEKARFELLAQKKNVPADWLR